LDSLLKIIALPAWLATAAVSGCAAGPVVGREVLADPAMRFAPGRPVEVLDPEARMRSQTEAPLPPNTVLTALDFSREPGSDADGTWFSSALRAAVEIFSGFALEAG
jgi:hypothetical protein